MSPRKYRLHDGKRGAAIAVRITPRASENKIVELQGDGTVRIHLTAAPADENINTELIKYLSEVLSVPAGRIEIVAGITSFDKIVSVLDVNTEMLHKRLLGHVG